MSRTAQEPSGPNRAAMPEAASSETAAEHRASADAIVTAMEASGISRLVVLSCSVEAGVCAGVRLARRIASAGEGTTVLVDLTSGDAVALAMGVARQSEGFAHLVGGRAELGDVIHRDHYSRVHVVPSAGFDWNAIGTDGQVKLFLAAFNEVYDRVVVECDPKAVPHLAAIMNPEAALILSEESGSSEESARMVGRLAEAGIQDVIVLDAPPVRR